jgi:hypothetical protein
LTVRCFRRPVMRAATSSCGRTVSRQGATCCGQVSGNRFHYRHLGGTAAALLPQPRRSCPLVVLPVDTDWTPTGPLAALRTAGVRDSCRIAGRCPNPCRTTAICNGCAGADASAVVSSSRASGPVGGHTDDDGSGWADVRCGRCPPAAAASPLGRTVAEPAADTRNGSAAAVHGCCPGFRTPRTARCIPPWPASGRDRYRNRSPGRRPLVGCSQRW